MRTATAILREKYEMFKQELTMAEKSIEKCEDKLAEAHSQKERIEKLINEFDAALTALENQGK